MVPFDMLFAYRLGTIFIGCIHKGALKVKGFFLECHLSTVNSGHVSPVELDCHLETEGFSRLHFEGSLGEIDLKRRGSLRLGSAHLNG